MLGCSTSGVIPLARLENISYPMSFLLTAVTSFNTSRVSSSKTVLICCGVLGGGGCDGLGGGGCMNWPCYRSFVV
jgi:hypothetical protein